MTAIKIIYQKVIFTVTGILTVYRIPLHGMEPDALQVFEVFEVTEKAFSLGDVAKATTALQTLFHADQLTITLDSFVQFFDNCKSQCNLKNNKSVAVFAARKLESWLTNQSSACVISEQTKTALMPVIANCHSTLSSILIELYQLNKPPNAFLKPYVMRLISRNRLKEATSLSFKLSLQEHFTLNDLVLPMLAQNKMSLVENYLEGSKPQQMETIALLDMLLSPNFDAIEFFKERHIFEVQIEILRPKFFSKLLVRWLKKFCDIDNIFSDECQQMCPNLCMQKSVANLKYILKRHYVEELSSVEVTQELIVKAVENNKLLQEQLVDILVTVYSDMESAKQWADLYEVKHEALSQYFSSRTSSNVVEEDQWDCECISSKQPSSESPLKQLNSWYELNLPIDKTVMVDSEDTLINCVQSIMNSDVIGIDSEWVPIFARTKEVTLALLQIATFNNAYLIDIPFIVASGPKCIDMFCELMSKILLSNDIMKIGYGIHEDMKNLTQTFPSLSPVLKKAVRVTDMCSSVNVLQQYYPNILRITDENLNEAAFNNTQHPKIEKGLSGLVQKCFGKPLNKSEQMSDWSRRPLRHSQIIYAALDAFVLLELYNFIHGKMKLGGMEESLETIIHVKRNGKNKMKTRVSRPTPQQNINNSVPLRKQIRPNQFKVVCDTMLQGLGKQLRCCGVDVKMLSNYDDHEVAAEIAVKDGRVILTCGAPYHYLSSQVPNGDCLNVPCPMTAKLQAAFVLEHYNVKVTPLDIFSRCQICNGGKYLKVSSEVMKQCVKRKHEMSFMFPLTSDTNIVSLNSIRPHPLVGRGRHVAEENFEMAKRSMISSSNVGRGRAMRKQMARVQATSVSPATCVQVESYANFLNASGRIRKVDPKQYTETLPLSFVDNEWDISTAASTLSGSEVDPVESKGIDMKTFSACANFRHPNSCKDGTIPYIVNPESVCAEGFVNMEDVTIVSSQDVAETSSCTDPLITILHCEQIPPTILSKIKLFYCCVSCGKVYWEGRHFRDVLEKFSDILITDEAEDLAALPQVASTSNNVGSLESCM